MNVITLPELENIYFETPGQNFGHYTTGMLKSILDRDKDYF